jgi:hypothetical protein
VTDKVMAPEQMARLFHDAYERLAPQFGYETRKDTRAFDPSTPNGKLMIATCAEVLAAAPSPAPVAKIEEPMDEPRREDYALDSLYFDDLRRYIDSLRAALVESENRACHHGWRGTVPDEGRSIQTPCPACGARSLFIGSGGHLTCSRVPSDRSDGCHSPSVEDTVKQLKQRAEQAESALAAAKAGAAPHQNADQPKAAPQAPCTPRRSSPGLAERPDSPNGVSLERAAILDETDSGVKPAGVAPRVEPLAWAVFVDGHEADYYVLAAAPDMLDALVALKNCRDVRWPVELEDMVYSAIAKAKGTTVVALRRGLDSVPEQNEQDV